MPSVYVDYKVKQAATHVLTIMQFITGMPSVLYSVFHFFLVWCSQLI